MADMQHILWLITFRGKLYNAPVENPQNVLDLATGLSKARPTSSIITYVTQAPVFGR